MERLTPVDFEHNVTMKRSPMEETQKHNAVILVVDDEEIVRKVVVSILGSNGYHVVTANSAAEAIEAINRYRAQIRLALIDVTLPDRDGLWVAACITKEIPTKIAIMSGYGPTSLNRDLPPGYLFLMKPFTPQQLLDRIKEFLA